MNSNLEVQITENVDYVNEVPLDDEDLASLYKSEPGVGKPEQAAKEEPAEEAAPGTDNKNKSSRLTSLDLEFLANNVPAPVKYLLPGIVEGTVVGGIAPGATGKSFFIQHILSAVSAGVENWHQYYHVNWQIDKPLLERARLAPKLGQSAPGKAMCFNGEDPLSVLNNRYYQFLLSLSDADRQSVVDAYKLGNLDIRSDSSPQKLMDGRGNLNEIGLARLEREAAGRKLIILDTFRIYHNGEESNNDHMGRLVSALMGIALRTGCVILYIHHTSKGATSGGKTEAESARGASAIVDNCRGLLCLRTLSGMGSEEDADTIKSGNIHPSPQAALRAKEPELYRGKFLRMTSGKPNYTDGDTVYWYHRGPHGVLYRIQDPADFAMRFRHWKKDSKALEEDTSGYTARTAPPSPSAMDTYIAAPAKPVALESVQRGQAMGYEVVNADDL